MNPTDSSPAERALADREKTAAIERWLTEQIAAEAELPLEQIDLQQPIASYGVDSMQVVTLLAQLEDRLGFRFASNPLDEHPTIAALAQFAVSQTSNVSTQS